METNSSNNAEETFVLRVTSENENTKFYSSYMTAADNGSLVTQLHETTPFKLFAKASLFGFMVTSIDGVTPIKVEMAKRDDPDNAIVSAEGISLLAHVETNGRSYIYSK